jgi:NAD(P)-dependent dehydrogenase (short-subunit alcohol dehydrogenase family)
MTDRRIAVVTGANRGLGLATARALGEQGFHVLMCCRDATKGAEAMKGLEADGLSVELRRLDVARSDETASLGRHIHENHGRVDVLINNAGMIRESRGETGKHAADPLRVAPTTVMETLNVNTLGALRMIQALSPLMPEGARIVNVSSGMGQLSDMDGGWLGYRMSKTALNTVTRVFASELKERGILVNSVCPGWVRTDLGGPEATLSIEEGIDTIVWLATAETASESGGFWRKRERIDW